MTMIRIYIIASLLIFSNPTYAYLDPGSGNALMYLLVSLGGALTFSIKNLYYRIIGKKIKQEEVNNNNFDLVIFSEGKQYWGTFKPLIEELLKRKIAFKYYTMDIYDPALEIDNNLINSRFLGYGDIAYARLSQCNAKFFISTTPNIGCPNYPLKRPKNVEKLIYISHAVSDISYLKKGALDNYDVVLDIAKWCEKRLRVVESNRKLKRKEFYPVGLLYLDELVKNYASIMTLTNKKNQKTILIAPSWGKKSCLHTHGHLFITELLEQGYRIIFRPHPQSFISELNFIKEIIIKNSKFPNFIIDKARDSIASIKESDILISDSSSFKFDYAFVHKKPVITLYVPLSDLDSYEGGEFEGLWEDDVLDKIGYVVHKDNVVPMREIIEKTLNKDVSQIENIYNELVCNHGMAKESIVDWLETKLKEGK